MLYKMTLIREFDEFIIGRRVAGKIYGVIHSYVGQEAVAVGVCSALTVTDRITSTHRGHGHCIAKGANVNRMMAELYGRVDGSCKGRGGSMHIADLGVGMLGANGIVGGGLPIATGAALAAELVGEGGVAVAFFGDGAVGEGVFHETMNIASSWRLPLLLVCENNLYASNVVSTDVRVAADISAFAPAYGMPGISVDGNDVMAVYVAARDAVSRARGGAGPTLIECKTFRWRFHAMREAQPTDTRPAADVESWKQRDPIAQFETYLRTRGVITDAELVGVRTRVKAELEGAAAFAEASPFPQPADVLADVFAGTTPA
jgi:pyruvate dehydrogenase E1 component alpha subunit